MDGDPSRAHEPSPVNFAHQRHEISVLLVERYKIVRDAVRAVLADDPNLLVVGEAATPQAALALIAELAPHVVLLCLDLPEHAGLGLLRQVKVRHPAVSVIVVSALDDCDAAVTALLDGASGYLVHGCRPALLLHAIHATSAGGLPVDSLLLRRIVGTLPPSASEERSHRAFSYRPEAWSESDRAILRLIAAGKTNREVAQVLSYAEITIKKRLQDIVAKLGATDRTHAAILAVRYGIIE